MVILTQNIFHKQPDIHFPQTTRYTFSTNNQIYILNRICSAVALNKSPETKEHNSNSDKNKMLLNNYTSYKQEFYGKNKVIQYQFLFCCVHRHLGTFIALWDGFLNHWLVHGPCLNHDTRAVLSFNILSIVAKVFVGRGPIVLNRFSMY